MTFCFSGLVRILDKMLDNALRTMLRRTLGSMPDNALRTMLRRMRRIMLKMLLAKMSS